jgi:dynein heavy chain 2
MWTPADIAGGTPLRAQLMFVLAWFHAVVQERRIYMPQGWTKFYEFSTGDLRAGADVLNAVCASGAPDWPTIHGLLESALYGGRVDNEYDTRVLRTYITQFFSPEVVSVPGARGASRRLAKDIGTRDSRG